MTSDERFSAREFFWLGLILIDLGAAIGRVQAGDSVGHSVERMFGDLAMTLLLFFAWRFVRWLSRFRIVRKERVQP